MALHISGENISDSWVKAYDALSREADCSAVNMTITVEDPSTEIKAIRREIDLDVAARKFAGERAFNKSVHTVANTIFPISLYRPGRPDAFYQAAATGQSGRNGNITSWGPNSGTYIGRLLRYPTYDKGHFNQLERVLKNLDADLNYQDCYEISLDSDTLTTLPDNNLPRSASASTYVPAYDNYYRGGQCLSHISLNLSKEKRLSMTALYRHQTYLSRAYGNFLGLSRLLHFLVRESRKDLRVGELMIVASHAEIEKEARSRRQILVRSCNAHLGEDPQKIEWHSRGFGQSWSDLRLPTVSA
ncbi:MULTISPECIES: hypothetical protein [unclassified Rhodococcus (in: high G+C Gram-positive bacteria)]|uniref:hypothetical protein n=1 Tax=unclassified Rhodococcus (in: high G+C Gram-positive bacteria) TaxID=192944 RepID=UPI00117B84F5|nr:MULTISPECIES: hypothetical protein [unclassified Rhodococcus (in: high G+C Gram-positive bacteria)]